MSGLYQTAEPQETLWHLPDIKSEEENEELITAYPAEVKEGNYYQRSK